jgi:hypothetical protein
VRADERERIRAKVRGQRALAIEEARRAWTALARREDYLRSVISTHYRMLGRSDIMYDPWMRGRESTGMTQREIGDIRNNIQSMIDRDVGECDVLMSWERFNHVLQSYDYQLVEEDGEGE